MGDATDSSKGKITLYTNHACPWAHRAHIALQELGLEYDEVIIDLEKPREQWYLDINDRGLVPTIQHTHPSLTNSSSTSQPATIIESALVVHYLIDAFPSRSSHILPPAKDPSSARQRYRTNLLIDTWFNKVQPTWMKAYLMTGTDEAESRSDELFEVIQGQIEGKLGDVLEGEYAKERGEGPFSAGGRLGLWEILVAPFILRIREFSNTGGRIHPESLLKRLDELPNFGPWSKALVEVGSVRSIWEREEMVERSIRRAPEMRRKFGVGK